MAIFFFIILATAAAVLLGARVLFDRQIDREIDALLADAKRRTPRIVTEHDLEILPEPVQRWLRYSNVVGTAVPSTVRLRQDGQFKLDSRGWMPFSAEQYFTIDPPGFLWKASFRMAPLLSVAGRDRYRTGEGSIEMRVLSIVPVAKKSGGGLNQGAMLRFLGEIQWFPAAAVAEYITWDAVDADTATATMTAGGVTGSMTIRFDADGRAIESSAMRYNDSLGRNERWVNRNDTFGEFNGIRVPVRGEARWEYESGPLPYIRWRITAIEQDRPMRFERKHR